jgi:hypothetical protein
MSEPRTPQTGTSRAGSPTVEPRRTGERLIALLILGGVLLNFPLLSLLRDRGLVAGVPALFVYLFLVWALIAGATALVLRVRPSRPRPAGEEPGPREP